jgi:tRNA(Ile2) C34 agmatinyltransferase TiaS
LNLLLELEKTIDAELDIIYRYDNNPICPICGLKMSMGGLLSINNK